MFEDIGKPNLVHWLALGVVAAVLPKLLPEMRPAMATAVKVVIDLLTESEAEAAEELMQALVSSTVAEINRHLAAAEDPEQCRRSVTGSLEHFKRKARQRAHRWGADHDDRRRRYRRHLAELRKEVEEAKNRHEGWQRNIFDDIGESIEEAA
jgi:Sec-independent protein translocase protein TatA